MRKEMKGTMTIEAAVIVPLILGMFLLLVWMLFYYHDKNVLSAIAHETVVMVCEKDDTIEDVEAYFQKRVHGKLLLFRWADVDVAIEDEVVHLRGIARKNRMALEIEMKMKQTEPEKLIRNIRRIGAIK